MCRLKLVCQKESKIIALTNTTSTCCQMAVVCERDFCSLCALQPKSQQISMHRPHNSRSLSASDRRTESAFVLWRNKRTARMLCA